MTGSDGGPGVTQAGSDGGPGQSSLPRGSADQGQVGSSWRTGRGAGVQLMGQDEEGRGVGLALTLAVTVHTRQGSPRATWWARDRVS